MSLLGKLFSGLPSNGGTSASRPVTAQHLESAVEDRFTYDLLFPSPEALLNTEFADPLSTSTILPSTTNAFDYNGDIDVEIRDVRIIIMQEATLSSVNPYLLYDSHELAPTTPTLEHPQSTNGPTQSQPRADARRSAPSSRKTSLGQNSRPVVIQQEPIAPRAFGAFDRRPTHTKTLSYTETEAQRAAREYKEEINMFSNCIWGQSDILAYKGVGTKVHPLPSDTRHAATSSSYQNDANGSFGRSSMRGSRLAQSFTLDNTNPGPTSAGFSTTSNARGSERRKVLITRMFPVPLPNDDTEDSQTRTPTALSQSNDTAGYPFPRVSGDGLSPETKKPQPKQKRTPMYAVGMIIQLPSAPQITSAPASRSSFRGAGSYTEQESFPSSFNSSRRSGWTMLGNGFGVESLESSFTSDVDDRFDVITPHWDIIMRTLSHLQAVTTAVLLPLLKQADINSPDPRRSSSASQHNRMPSVSVSISGKRVADDVKPFKIPKTNAKLVQLTQKCLSQNQKIQKEVDSSRQRIVNGIKARQVVTGQGRWGIWREQARESGKWAGGKEQGFFFFNLLTGFLGNHTEWLQVLGPTWYRRRHYQQQRANKDEDISLPARTIIVSDNKMEARRLVFLLAAFLPSNHQVPGARLHRPSTSASFGGYSQSPPTYTVPRPREESLRHKINRRPAGNARSTHSRKSSFATQVNQNNGLGLSSGHQMEIHHDRRVSDAGSIKTANLPIPGSDLTSRKSTTATASTAKPETTLTHFVTSRRPGCGTGPMPRPGSSGSLATDDLLRSLKRGDSTYSNASTESQANSRWGSMISGFWGSRRRDSSANTDATMPSIEGLEINDPHYTGGAAHPRDKLAEMVVEAGRHQTSQAKKIAEREAGNSDSDQTVKLADGETESLSGLAVKVEDIVGSRSQVVERVPDPSGAFESPVKTSINDDGIIDIDIPMPDLLSFETAVSSPSSSGYLSTPGFGNGLEGFEHYSRAGPDSDTNINVGGWLQRYHPDFALQAIPAYAELLEEVKASMRAEPTPILTSTPNPDGRPSRWVDISSAIIADTTNFTIKRIRYSRLVKLKDMEHTTANAADTMSRYGNVYSTAQLTPSFDIYDSHMEEKFVEEAIISMDETLIEAVERIIAQSGEGSKATSACSSRSTSVKAGVRERSDSGPELKPTTNHIARHPEVPRNECRKMVLNALEEIVKEVAESRREGGETEEKESVLREGVRSWLVNVETME
ncbi:hypothetical protein BP6252_08738 [Coleophoma cylindrospora]|uniref:Folliculin-interacting protein N-terminal domain-containing protein n=1 Tax=Coleophoma cylindrospora TaxID=1849047 RepID=A0A3D8R6Y0_9HELO|nr:hypothetical protein BP6252_08738 [Coleophoma cylindrospora]